MLVNIKIFRKSYIANDPSAVPKFEKELTIHRLMKHKNIAKLIGYGNQGTIQTPGGRSTSELVYSTTEHV